MAGATLAARARARAAAAAAGAARGRVVCSAPRRAAAPSAGARRVAMRAETEDRRGGVQLSPSCSIDDMEGCSLADLEMMYIDALWTYYTSNKFMIQNDVYDKLKQELAWQGSEFPTLKRYEVEFVKAVIENARGTPIMSNNEYERLKAKVKKNGKRKDVTALLLYAKGQQTLSPEQFDELSESMKALGIDVALKGAACTLNNDPSILTKDAALSSTVLLAVSAIPAVLAAVPYAGVSYFYQPLPLVGGVAFSLATGLLLGQALLNRMQLNDAEVLVGACTCCETPVKQLFAGNDKLPVVTKKCDNCGTLLDISREKMEILQGTPQAR